MIECSHHFKGNLMKLKAIGIFLSLFLLCACSSLNKKQNNVKTYDQLYEHMVTGDLKKCMAELQKVLASNGVLTKKRINLHVTDYKKVMCYHSGPGNRITMTRMIKKEEAEEFWQFWANFLNKDLPWQSDEVFKNKNDMHLLANYMMLTLLAHEMSHHVRYIYNVNSGFAVEELGADYLCIGILNQLSSDPRFARLKKLYYDICTIYMVKRVPDKERIEYPNKKGWQALHHKNFVSYSKVKPYVSQHWARQRMLMNDFPTEAIKQMAEMAVLKKYREQSKGRELSKNKIQISTIGSYEDHKNKYKYLFIEKHNELKKVNQTTLSLKLKYNTFTINLTKESPLNEINKYLMVSKDKFLLSDKNENIFLFTIKGNKIEHRELKGLSHSLMINCRGLCYDKNRNLYSLNKIDDDFIIHKINPELSSFTKVFSLKSLNKVRLMPWGPIPYGDGDGITEPIHTEVDSMATDGVGNFFIFDSRKQVLSLLNQNGLYSISSNIPGHQDGSATTARVDEVTMLDSPKPGIVYFRDKKSYGNWTLRQIKYQP